MTAPSFFVSWSPVAALVWVLLPVGVSAQRVRPELSVGYTWTGTVLERPHQAVSGTFAPAPELGAGAAVPLGSAESQALTLRVSYTPTQWRVSDVSGTRDVQSLSIVRGLVGVRMRLHQWVGGASFGLAHLSTASRGLFADGIDLSPSVEASAGVTGAVGAHRWRVSAVGGLEHFSTPVLKSEGGSGGMVARAGIRTSLTWNGAR